MFGVSSELPAAFVSSKLALNMSLFCSEGRGAAAQVDAWLMSNTRLPVAGGIKTRVSGNYLPSPL